MLSYVPFADAQAFQHSSFIPAKPAEIAAERDLSAPSFAFTPFDIQVGESAVQTFTPEPEDTHATFFARIASANVVDENGQNPLTISMEPGRVVFRSGARLRLSGVFAVPFFFGNQDASPVPARVIDTITGAVLHGDEILSEVLDGLAARYTDPRSMVVGQRAHPPFASLVSLGATEGDTIDVYHGAGVDSFMIDNTVSAIEFVAFIQNSHALNTAMGNRIDAYIDQNLQNVVVFSKTNSPISIMATRTATYGAVFGLLPA